MKETESNFHLATLSLKHGLEVNVGFLQFMYKTNSKAGGAPWT